MLRKLELPMPPIEKNFGNIKDESDSQTKLLTLYSYHKFKWVIKNFQSYSTKVAQYYESPHFFTGTNEKYQWALDIYLAGISQDTCDYIEICAYLCDDHRHKNANFIVQFSILDKDDKNRLTKCAKVIYKQGCIHRFISSQDLQRKPELLPNDELRIICEIFDFSNKSIKLDEDINKIALPRHIQLENSKKLLGSEKYSDFKLVMKDKEFRVHRAILAIQSPVFEAMFDSNMREANEGEVRINDIEPKVMEKLLHFIYTGIIDLEDLADKVLVAAEKYQLESLKSLCEDTLAKGLSTDNVYDILSLADQNNAVNLKTRAIEFFDKNLKELVQAADFKASVESLPKNVLANIIHDYALKR